MDLTRTKVKFFCLMLLAATASIWNLLRRPLTHGACQTMCNVGAVACYKAAGFTFGTITAGAGIPAVILGCNAAQGICMRLCWDRFK